MTNDDIPTYYFLHASWRTYQALSDLKALGQKHWTNVTRSHFKLTADTDAMFANTDASSAKKLSSEALAGLVDLINDNQVENSVRVVALTMFLIDSLHSVILKHDQDIVRCRLVWLYNAEWLKELPKITRATLMNGFRENDSFHESKDMWDIWHTPIENFQTKCFCDVSKPLIRIAQSSSEALLQSVALANHGYRQKEHYIALRKVIFEFDCQMTDEHINIPHEVVSLTSYVPSEAGFREMTAVMLVSDAKNPRTAVMESNWTKLSDSYVKMHESDRVPILDGFRHLYETNVGWEPSAFEDNQEYPSLLPPPVFEDDLKHS